MCMSRLYRVLGVEGSQTVDVEAVDGTRSRVSLLALDGAPPAPGDWVSVHSGYVIDRVDPLEAAVAVAEVRRAIALGATEDREVCS